MPVNAAMRWRSRRAFSTSLKTSVPGTAYTGAHSWRSTSYGVSNAKALEILKYPSRTPDNAFAAPT